MDANTFALQDSFAAPLGQVIQREYNRFNAIACKITTQKRLLKEIDGTGGKASVADIIAYQIGWGRLLIGWYESGIKGEKAEMPGEGFSKWDYVGLAQHFAQKYHLDASIKQMQLFHETVSRILIIVETEHQLGNLDKLGVWPWCTLPSGKKWALSKWITVNTSSPYKRATAAIKRSSLFL